MDTLGLRIKYRPLKIGWCLNAGDIDGLRKAMRLSISNGVADIIPDSSERLRMGYAAC